MGDYLLGRRAEIQDMKVFYRIYPGKPDDRPFANGEKDRLMGVCLTSFLESCLQAKANIQLHVLLDGCPFSWKDAVHRIVRSYSCEGLIQYTIDDLGGIGNKPSFLKQLEMALDGRSNEFVYFAEDDYLYRPEAIGRMVGIAGIGLVTPYDHPDRYLRSDNRPDGALRIMGDYHWRTHESTTMTFGISHAILTEVQDIMREHACEGRKMWYPILDVGYKIWGPVPSLATHVHDGVLAPCVDWSEVWHGR